MSLRVIAGSARGKRLKPVPGDTTRPIMDRVKEALFSIIGPYIVGATMLDLYAGTGSVGIEALSRGASRVTFNDLNRRAIATIEENLRITRMADRARITMLDALTLLSRAPDVAIDYLFIAPPQYKNLWRMTLETLDKYPAWLHENTIVIVQIDPSEYENVVLTHLSEYDRRRYGNTLLLFYESVAEDSLTER